MMMNQSSFAIRFVLVVAASFATQTSAGYCNWGPAGTGASSTCDLLVQGGAWCNANQSQCEAGCGGKWCTNDGGPSPPSSTPPTGPGTRTATTTRYWDCSGGSCACSYIPTGLSESAPAFCHSNAMFAAPTNNPFGAKFYGTAAISESLGGGNWMSSGCGKCWKVTGTSNIVGYSGVTTTLVLKGTNFCPNENPMCGAGPHFDIAAPGFDVLEFSFAHTCPEREPEEAAGFAACGSWLIRDDNVNNCYCSRFISPVLRKGCENFFSLKWNNPTVTYEEVTCPQELASLHCAHPYALEATMPATCANNVVTSGTPKPTPKPTLKPTLTPTLKLTSKPTSKPTSTGGTRKPTPKPTRKPTPMPTTSLMGKGYCNWGPAGTGASSTCDLLVQGGAWCNESQSNCEAGCGGKWCTNN